jgi:hypothetical protein
MVTIAETRMERVSEERKQCKKSRGRDKSASHRFAETQLLVMWLLTDLRRVKDENAIGENRYEADECEHIDPRADICCALLNRPLSDVKMFVQQTVTDEGQGADDQ